MLVEPIVCSQCGAPLEVPAGVGFVTCNHCHAQLAVRREASVTYTEAIQKLASQTEQLSDHVAQLRYESELERIDREWRVQRREWLITDRRGNQTRPNPANALVLIIASVVMGVLFAVPLFAGRQIKTSFLLLLFYLVPVLPIIALTLYAGLSLSRKAKAYRCAEADYQRRRAAVRLEDFQTPEE